MAEHKQTQTQIEIELPQDLDEIYTNFAMISHTPSEFVVDYARLMPNTPKAKIRARIIMTPMNAKLLLQALAENVQKFEQQFGEIKTNKKGFSSNGYRPPRL